MATATISGTILDVAENPVAGGVVSARLPSGSGIYDASASYISEPVITATTEVDGSYVLTLHTGATYRIREPDGTEYRITIPEGTVAATMESLRASSSVPNDAINAAQVAIDAALATQELGDHADVELGGLEDGDALLWNEETEQWKPGLPPSPDLTPYALQTELDIHTTNVNNPHNVTPAQIGAAQSVHAHASSDVAAWLANLTSPLYIPAGLRGTYTRLVIIDQGGRGDFTTVKAACDYVATQTRNTFNGWIGLVQSGVYAENNLVVPTNMVLVGAAGPAPNWDFTLNPGAPLIWDSGKDSSGVLVTLSNYSGMIGIGVYLANTPTGQRIGVQLSGSRSFLTDCYIVGATSANTHEVILVDAATTFNGYLTRCGWDWTTANVANAKMIRVTGNVEIADPVIRTLQPVPYALYQTAGTSVVFFARFGRSSGSTFTWDLFVSGGTCYINNSPYERASGNIIHVDRWRTTLSGLSVATASDQVPDTVQAASGQTAMLRRNLDSTGMVRSGVNADGAILLSTTNGMPADAPAVGTMKIDPATGLLWLRTNAGWISK